MANWAVLQEQLTGLPVAKRAKYGIHFQKGANEFVANFSGKPCHYEDGGIWKPIDTKLVKLPDGFYGCPHSPVRVHPDGRVKVKGTDYVQRTELPSASAGLADNDRLVREFSFGKQEMRITENGFKSEITLNRIPTLAEARKLVASESGKLSKKYMKSLTTATDANRDVHTFTTLSAFRTWLASAVFPVVIDPDLNLQPNPTDGMDAVYYVDWGGDGTGPELWAGTFQNSANFARIIIKFDVSSIQSTAEISTATMSLYLNSGQTESAITHYIYRVTNEWAETQVTWANRLTGTAWTTSGGDKDGTQTDSVSVSTYSAWYSWNIKTDVEKWVSGTANNYGNIIVGKEVPASNSIKKFLSSDYTTNTSLRPKLSVTYTSGTFIPINMNAQFQNLAGGIRG